ncbi:hypothetical protein CHS0354_028019 [Potamilus streckersoni]|uniref:Carbohydrate sulfotransferase n=1 Tax=Potamilus streckersoni TaxID=2493646 RepID=A0AAE0VGS4_9BIVA|nr:hypothetical protein CHS0354_028019 [Potamilus streckersoni]
MRMNKTTYCLVHVEDLVKDHVINAEGYRVTESSGTARPEDNRNLRGYFDSADDYKNRSDLYLKQNSFGVTDNKLLSGYGLKWIDEHKRRIEHIKNVCASYHVMGNATAIKPQRYFLYSKHYNFEYCIVPKIGCTYWKQLFKVLELDHPDYKAIFSQKRAKVHKTVQFINRSQGQTGRLIQVARNPFSRLYSAYIDKIYLPIFKPAVVNIERWRRRTLKNRKVKGGCANEITFQEFLEYISVTEEKGLMLNPHWRPVSSMCSTCSQNVILLVKQESFVKDVQFTLRYIGVDGEKYERLSEAMTKKRIELSLPGIVETVLNLNFRPSRCMDGREIARRLWFSFQIQGYIDVLLDFPETLFDPKVWDVSRNGTYISDIVLTTINTHPLSREKSQQQRYTFLRSAYMSVDKNILKRIVEIYSKDFELFQYSKVPPS